MTRSSFLAGFLSLFGLGSRDGDSNMVISKDDVKRGLADNSIHLIDVRERDEFAVGHVAGAINQPLSSFDPKALPQDGKTIVLMCRSGNRSGKAQSIAAGAGIKTLNYAGSMNEWKASGEPVVTGR